MQAARPGSESCVSQATFMQACLALSLKAEYCQSRTSLMCKSGEHSLRQPGVVSQGRQLELPKQGNHNVQTG